jgi:hypothetical protein
MTRPIGIAVALLFAACATKDRAEPRPASPPTEVPAAPTPSPPAAAHPAPAAAPPAIAAMAAAFDPLWARSAGPERAESLCANAPTLTPLVAAVAGLVPAAGADADAWGEAADELLGLWREGTAACADPGARGQVDDALAAMRARFDTLRR